VIERLPWVRIPPFCHCFREDIRIVVSPNDSLEGMCCVSSPDYLLKPRAELGFGKYFSPKMGRIQFSPEFEIDRVTIFESPFSRSGFRSSSDRSSTL